MAERFKAAVWREGRKPKQHRDEVDGSEGVEGSESRFRNKIAVVARNARLAADRRVLERWPSGLRQQS